jgi:acetoin utilization deacetylase AcuC-like enzyme
VSAGAVMRCFFDHRQLAHAPAFELHNGSFVPFAESPSRAVSILASLGEVTGASDHGEAPLAAVHAPAYLEFLRSAHREWQCAGREGDAVAYAWPVVRRRPLPLERIDARLGAHSFDASSPISAGTWEGAYWSAQTALSALGALSSRCSRAFALCRPPGHHSGADYLGGYCYLNNAAIVAQEASRSGRRVAILDVDYHHGNGTQDIFYERGDVLFVSIHADPRLDYPYFWGHADERGEADGEGATLNIPLPRGTGIKTYLPALEEALETVAGFVPDLLVCSFGADTFAADPISYFKLETSDYRLLAGRIGQLGGDLVVVQEGGYAVAALGDNVAAFLEGLS